MASSSKEASASPTSSDPCWKYDVFLSFRGPDTRKGITVDIYDGLNRRGIRTFMDDPDLQVGDVISPTLIAAIKKSRFAIVILSQNFASSTWCLEELREICLSMEDNRILPLFYHVDPTEVRYQKEGCFKEAFSKHATSGKYEAKKVNQWRAALNKVASFSGWNTQQYKTDRELVNFIVEFVCSKFVCSPEDFEVFKATRQAMDEVNQALVADDITAIGVYGMGGVGKTTLVEHVGAQARKSGIFNYVTKSVVFQNPDFRKLQDTLAEQLAFELHEETEVGRAARLRKEIKKREKILLILDDIWERLDLSRIGIPTYKELQKCNSKVLLTTRITNVCHQMKCQRKITLNFLSEQDSWALFARKARTFFESRTFEDVAKKVAKECKGLPIALIAVARALGDKDSVEWMKAAQRLMMSQTADPDDDGRAYKCIKLSYDFLKDQEYKSFFLLCCLFPEDFDIPLEDLFRYAIGKGLFQDADTLQEARERAESLARHLQNSCLLLEGKYDGYLRMHDVVRDATIQIAQSEEGFLVKAGYGLEVWPRQLHEGCSAISLMSNDIRKVREKLVCPKLQILLLNYNDVLDKIPETFFQSPNELRVLDFSWTGISILPQSFMLLTCLQGLYLDGCERITDISMVGKLVKLEILSMRDIGLEELPRVVGNLTNLRLLDITGARIARIPSKLISRLYSLEELYMDCEFGDWGGKVDGEGDEINAGFDEVTSLSKLRRLKVWISNEKCIPKFVDLNPNWPKFIISIGKHEKMEASYQYGQITLTLDCISNFPDWFFKAVMNKAETLKWIGCPWTGLIDVFVEYEHGRLHGLKRLFVLGADNKELLNTSTWVPKEPVFENLEELLLWRVELYAVELPPGSLCNLKLLDVGSCYNWGDVLLRSTGLPNLEELKCDSMDEIEYVFGYEGSFDAKQSKLRKIELSHLKRVRSICEGTGPPAVFQNLQSLFIQRCNLQGSLFTYDIAQRLFQLNILVLKECPLLERIVEASNKKTILPNLKQLCLKELPMLYYESATLDIECPSLEDVDVTDCPKVLVPVSDFHSRSRVKLHEGPFVRTEILGDILDSMSTHTGGSEVFEGTGQAITELMEVQTDEEVSAIGVYGTGGVGKTNIVPFGSSSSAVEWKYDVYLSFSGADTQKGFTSTLFDRLRKRGIRTFMDLLQVRDANLTAIEESRFAIVVLSPNYAASTWCLEELTKICHHMILPVFYDIEGAFTYHEASGQHQLEKVQQWKDALRKMGWLDGWHAQDYKSDIELMEAIVEYMCSKIYRAGFEVFDATRRAMDEVMKALKDEDVTVFGVYGAGGVGKTAMIKHVSAQVENNGMFDHVIRAVVSRSPDLRNMQGKLADMLGLELEEETDIGRAHRLMQKIRRGSRILIILDDIWESIYLSSIGIPGNHDLQRCNSKVLLITRTENVLCAMECRPNIRLDVLSEKDSWTLLMKRARMTSEWIDSCQVAKKVARGCAGLPIALTAVAKALGDKDDWEEAGRRIKSSQPVGPEDGMVVYNCIKLSYDHLAYDDARSCLLLCCLFPEDDDIHIEDLLNYGMGMGLFQDSSTMQDARASAHSVVKYLRDCSLLLESQRDGCVKMHDDIREVAITISSSEDRQLFFVRAGCQLKEWPSISATGGYCAISLIRNEICKLPEELVNSELLILFMQSNVCLDQIPKDFFQGLSKLRVLNLSRTRISLLPTSFSFLRNLHSLYLDGCLSIINNISELVKLDKLEILSMRDLPLVELPKELGRLSNLKMLDVTGGYVDIVPSEVICNLHRLEELYMQCNFADWRSEFGGTEVNGGKVDEAGEKDIAAFDELTGLSRLNILKVFISDTKSLPTDVAGELNWVSFDIGISRNSSVRAVSLVSSSSPVYTRTLTLGTTINTLPDWFINVVTSKTEKLQYRKCRELDNILVEYDRGRLHALKYLSVIGPSENLKVLMDMDTITRVRFEPVFQNLKELHLVQVECLNELCVGELPSGSLCNLRLLKVKHCYELVDALLPSNLLQGLKNLEELICEEIDELEYVFGCEGLTPEQIILTELKEMRLENLGKLIKIWNGPAPSTIFKNLHSFVVSECYELKYLFTADVAQWLVQLEDLSVEHCPSLERVIEVSEFAKDKKIILPRLKNLALIKLPQLRRFYGDTISALQCPQLETLYNERCPLFSPSDFNKSISSSSTTFGHCTKKISEWPTGLTVSIGASSSAPPGVIGSALSQSRRKTMYLKNELQWNVVIPAECLDAKGLMLQKEIVVRLLDDFAKRKATKDYGNLLALTTVEKIGEGKVRHHTGDVRFPVTFSAISFKLFRGEILEGVVHKVLKQGVILKCGPIENVYLSSSKMPDYTYVPGENPVFLNDKAAKIVNGITLRFIVIGAKWLEAERVFQALVGLDADYLGPFP